MATTPFIIYTYGNQDIVYEILMSISTFFGGGLISSMVKLAGITTILMFLFNAIGVTTSNPNRPLDLLFFIKFYLIYSIFVLTGTTSDVVIKDTMTNQTKVISNPAIKSIPLGLVVINSYTSQVFYALIQGYERYFQTGASGNPALSYTKSGMAFGSNFVANLSSVSSGDPVFDQNLQNYFGNCGLPVACSQGGMTELTQTTDMVTFFSSKYENVQKARFVVQVDPSGVQSVIDCWSAINQIKNVWNAKSNSYFSYFANLAGFSESATANFIAAGNASASQFLNISSSGSDALKQAIAINVAYKAIQTNATQVNNEALALAAYDAQQFQQYKAGGELSGEQAARIVPALKNFAEALLYMLYPLMVFYALLASSFGAVIKYIKFSATINAIPLIYEVLSWGINWYAVNKTGAVSSSNGYNLLTASNMYNLNANIVAAANWLAMSTPALAYMLVSGSDMAITSLFGHATDPGKSTATSTGSEMSKGNLNMGNTNIDNTSYNNSSYNNLSANKFNNVMDMTIGSSQINKRFDSGSTVSSFGDNSSVINSPISSGPITSTGTTANTKQLSESYNKAIQSQQQAATDMSVAYKAAGQYAVSHGLSWSGTHDKGSGVDITNQNSTGANNRISSDGSVGIGLGAGSGAPGVTGSAKVGFGSASASQSGWDKSTVSRDVNTWRHSELYGKDEKFSQMVDKVDSAQHKYSDSIAKSESFQQQLSIASTDAQQMQQNQNNEIWNSMVQKYGVEEAQLRFSSSTERGQYQKQTADSINKLNNTNTNIESGHSFANTTKNKFDNLAKQAQNNVESHAKTKLHKEQSKVINKSTEGIESSKEMTKGNKVNVPRRQEWKFFGDKE